jgi:hypothetical protein
MTDTPGLIVGKTGPRARGDELRERSESDASRDSAHAAGLHAPAAVAAGARRGRGPPRRCGLNPRVSAFIEEQNIKPVELFGGPRAGTDILPEPTAPPQPLFGKNLKITMRSNFAEIKHCLIQHRNHIKKF